MSSASAWPAEVTISDLGANVLLESVSQGMVRFGAALPAAELLPTDRLNRILAERTGQPVEKIAKDTDRDNFMSAEDAVSYGLVDKIFVKRGEQP